MKVYWQYSGVDGSGKFKRYIVLVDDKNLFAFFKVYQKSEILSDDVLVFEHMERLWVNHIKGSYEELSDLHIPEKLKSLIYSPFFKLDMLKRYSKLEG